MPTETEQTADTKKPSRLWVLLGAGAFVLGSGAMMAAGKSAPQGVDTERVSQPDLVEVATVEAAPQTFTVRAPGRLKPRQELVVVGEVSGKVVEINPDLTLGGRIEKGEVLFRIDPGDVNADLSRAKAALETAKARLAQATAERDRQVRLAEIGAAPEKAKEAAVAAFEDAQAAVKQAEAQVQISSRSVSKSVVRAPFDAIVVQEQVALGSFVSPGASLARLIDAGEGEIVAGLSPGDVRAVRAALSANEGERIAVRAVPNSGSIGVGQLEGYVESFSPVIDPASRTVSVVAVFPDAFAPSNEGLIFADDYMTLEIEARSDAPLYRLPNGALRQESWVWVVDENDVIHRREVTPVDRNDAGVLVASRTFASGDRVMTTVLAEELEGMRVRVAGEAR